MLTVWSMPGCTWCVRVCEALADAGKAFEKHEPALVELKVLMRAKGLTTLPQVWDGDTLIGGYTDTVAWLKR